jgi:hypothetical protein
MLAFHGGDGVEFFFCQDARLFQLLLVAERRRRRDST